MIHPEKLGSSSEVLKELEYQNLLLSSARGSDKLHRYERTKFGLIVSRMILLTLKIFDIRRRFSSKGNVGGLTEGRWSFKNSWNSFMRDFSYLIAHLFSTRHSKHQHECSTRNQMMPFFFCFLNNSCSLH